MPDEPKGFLQIHSAGYHAHEHPHVWDTGAPLPDYDLVVVLSGSGVFEWGKESVRLRAGDCILCRKGTRYVQRIAAPELMTEVYIHFDWIGAHAPTTKSLPHVVHGIEDVGFFRTLVLRVVEAHHRKEAQMAAAEWLNVVLLELKSHSLKGESCGPQRDRELAIRRVTMEVLENVNHPWKVEDMAQKAGMSPDHFRRVFRRVNGTSAGEFVINSKLEAAKHHLRHSNFTIGEIADYLGHCDLAAFSRSFKIHTGVSPSKYRQMS